METESLISMTYIREDKSVRYDLWHSYTVEAVYSLVWCHERIIREHVSYRDLQDASDSIGSTQYLMSENSGRLAQLSCLRIASHQDNWERKSRPAVRLAGIVIFGMPN